MIKRERWLCPGRFNQDSSTGTATAPVAVPGNSIVPAYSAGLAGTRSDCQRYRITPTQMPESATLNVG